MLFLFFLFLFVYVVVVVHLGTLVCSHCVFVVGVGWSAKEFLCQYTRVEVELRDIDSVEQIDANRGKKLVQNDANWGQESPKLCKFLLENT